MKVPDGFVNAKTIKPKHRLIVSITGPQKTGKTNFGLTAPGPLGFFDMDLGTEGVVEKFSSTSEIYLKQYDYRTMSGSDPVTGGKLAWEALKGDYRTMMGIPTIRSILWDTGTELWELGRMARFGQLNSPGANVKMWYGPLNAEVRDLVRLVYGSDKNLIITHKTKDEYVNDHRTGNLVRAGFGDMGFLVQVNLRSIREDTEDGPIFKVLVEDCRQNPAVIGMVLEGEMCNFEFLMSLVFGG